MEAGGARRGFETGGYGDAELRGADFRDVERFIYGRGGMIKEQIN